MRLVLDSYNLAAAERLLCVEAYTQAVGRLQRSSPRWLGRHHLKRLIIKHRIEWPRNYTPRPLTA